MAQHDFEAFEAIEFDASVDLYRAAPPAFRDQYGIEARDVGATTCLISRSIEPAAMFRRIVRLGIGKEATMAELDGALSTMDALNVRYAVPVAPVARPASLAGWLEGRGFTHGYAWMKFARPCVPVDTPTCELGIRVVGSESAEQFGRVVADGFGMAPVAPWVAELPGRPGWVCMMAFAGELAVAAGAAFIKGDYAWLGFGATLADHRRKGAQSALLAHRLAAAAAHGARVAVTETGERLPDRPSHSYRNILRAGFNEMYLRQNYLSPVT